MKNDIIISYIVRALLYALDISAANLNVLTNLFVGDEPR